MNPKSVLITGANRGIGLEFVKQFLNLEEPPTYLFAACRSPDDAKDLKELQKKSTALKIVRLDLANLDTIDSLKHSIEKLVGSHGLNLLINNAGIAHQDGLMQVTEKTMQDSFNVNVVGPVMISQAFAPLLIRASTDWLYPGMSCNRAAIINISSQFGSIEELEAPRFQYNCSKAALNMMTKGLSIELQKDEVLVASICPGWVNTDLGGPDAPQSPETSVKKMMTVMATLTDTGTFRSNCGRTIAW